MDSLGLDDSDDPRDVELSSLTAIYPEIQQVRPDDRYTIALDVPVTPSKAVAVSFPATAGPTQSLQPNPNTNHAENGVNREDQQEVEHLPPVHLEISFGPGYPVEQPPRVTISTTPPWLPLETIKKLEDDGPRLWEEMGREIVGFTYIDHIQQAAEQIFGLVGQSGILEVDAQHKISILDYDIQARRAAFERETFDCGVCLDPKKGSFCHKMMDCGHVFCVQCLQDFYNDAIEKGELASVRCLAPSCARDREKVATRTSGKKRKKIRTFISPSELLQIPLDQEKVKRYVALKYKTELESDKNTIYCPRQWCNGAARSKKHKKPQGLELCDASDEDEDDNGEDSNAELNSKTYVPTERLAICEECSFAFCSRCLQSWHGEFVHCTPRRDKDELTAEEKASLEYMKLHTTPCPTCAAPAQKTQGCNHMICGRCQTHFCYLCSAWLDPGNPYQHFNEMPGGRVTGCYMRLWELEQGDGDDVGHGFFGGRAQGVAREGQVQVEVEEPEDIGAVGDAPVPAARPVPGRPQEGQPPENAREPVGVAREGPLVLRIGGGDQPAGGGQGAAPRGQAVNAAGLRQPPAGRGRDNHHEANPRGRGGGRGRGRGRGGQQEQQQGQRGLRGGGLAQGNAQLGQRGEGRGGGGGGRGRGRGPPGGAVAPHRQNAHQGLNQAQAPAAQQRRNNNINNNNQNQNRNQNHDIEDGGRGEAGAGAGAGEDAWAVDLEAGDGARGGLNAAQEAWIRQFVQLAMDDEEDEMLEDDDDEAFGVMFWPQ